MQQDDDTMASPTPWDSTAPPEPQLVAAPQQSNQSYRSTTMEEVTSDHRPLPTSLSQILLQPHYPPQQQPPQRSRPIAIIRRKSSELNDDDDDMNHDSSDNEDTSTNATSTTTTTTMNTRHHHSSMPNHPRTATTTLLRAPLLSSIPTSYDQEDTIPEFQLSASQQQQQQQQVDHDWGPVRRQHRTGNHPETLPSQAYGSLRESQMQQRFLLDHGKSMGTPHSFLRKRGTFAATNSRTTTQLQMSASVPIRPSSSSSTTAMMGGGMTIGERIQQQRKIQLALLESQNNTGSDTTTNQGMEYLGPSEKSSMSSLVSVNTTVPSNTEAITAKPKRTSSLLAAMLDQQQPPPPPPPHPQPTLECDTNRHNTNTAVTNPSISDPPDDIRNTDATNLSLSFTGLEILQQHRRPWIALSKHRSLPPTKSTTITSSSSTTQFLMSSSSLHHPSQQQQQPSMGMSRSLSQPFLLHQSLSQPDPSQFVSSVSSTYTSVFHHPSHSAATVSHHSPPLTQYTTMNTAHDRVLNDSNNSVDTTTTANYNTDIRTTSGSFLLPPTAHRTTTNSSSLLLNRHVQQSYLPPPSRMERAMDHVDDIDMDANDDDDDDDGIGEAFDLDME